MTEVAPLPSALPSPAPERGVRRPMAFRLAACVLLVLVTVAVAAPAIAPDDPDAQDLSERFEAPGSDHLLGTDEFGRDQLSRLIHGARVSLFAALIAVTVGVVVGAPLGLLAGFKGGWLDILGSRFNDMLMSVPALILALTIVAVLGNGLTNAMVAVGFVFAPIFFRVARASTKDVRGELFIEAVEAIGCSTRRVVYRHVLPNALPPLIVQFSIVFGLAVSAEASLSFLGLGVQPPAASWGSMLATAFSAINGAPYLIYPPGLMITVTVLTFSVLGDGLRDRLGARRHDLVEV